MVVINDVTRWKTTLRYDDQNGQTRWHKASLPTRYGVVPKVGDHYQVRYDPARPGRRSSIYVNLRKPRKSGSRG